MLQKGISFPEAVLNCRTYGIDLPRNDDHRSRAEERQCALYEALSLAERFFSGGTVPAPGGKPARDNLEKRGNGPSINRNTPWLGSRGLGQSEALS
jgi:hypothetical protein